MATECEHSVPDVELQRLLKIYLNELDRRRNTDHTKLFPGITKLFPIMDVTKINNVIPDHPEFEV